MNNALPHMSKVLTSRSNGSYSFPNRFNDTSCFMPEDAWEQSLRIVSVHCYKESNKRNWVVDKVHQNLEDILVLTCVDISMTKCVCHHFHSHFSCLWWINYNCLQRKRLLSSAGYHGLAFDGFADSAHYWKLRNMNIRIVISHLSYLLLRASYQLPYEAITILLPLPILSTVVDCSFPRRERTTKNEARMKKNEQERWDRRQEEGREWLSRVM
jgi:hypothetical protein